MNASLIEQLNHVYLNEETWHDNKLSPSDATKYHTYLLESGNLITYVDPQDNLLGYVEFLRINKQQWERIIFNLGFYVLDEDIRNGPICHVHNGWIHREHRGSGMLNVLGLRLFRENSDCLFFSENPLRRPGTDPKIFRRDTFKRRFKNFGW